MLDMKIFNAAVKIPQNA